MNIVARVGLHRSPHVQVVQMSTPTSLHHAVEVTWVLGVGCEGSD